MLTVYITFLISWCKERVLSVQYFSYHNFDIYDLIWSNISCTGQYRMHRASIEGKRISQSSEVR